MNQFENDDFENTENTTSENAFKSDDNTPCFNPVNYSPVTPLSEQKNYSSGLKIFALILIIIIALTATTAAGYVYGKNSVAGKTKAGKVDVNLAARPKDDDQYTSAQVYSLINESVVGIRVFNSEGKVADASGVIYTKDGYIITNDHIYSEIAKAQFKIYMFDGTEYNANYVAGDTISDLAVLKIESENEFKVPVFGNSQEIVCGENVVAVGRPSDATASSSITCGIISLPKRRMQTTSNYSASFIQTDSAINPGSSGGALINMYGQIIGITASKLAGVQYDAVGFAIPTTTVKRVVEQLIKHSKVIDRAKLGITYKEVNSVTAQIENFSNIGLYIDSVAEDSDIYGKAHKNDLITHINGILITNDDIVLDIIEESYAGDIVKLTIVSSNGITNTYEVTLKANIGQSSYIEN